MNLKFPETVKKPDTPCFGGSIQSVVRRAPSGPAMKHPAGVASLPPERLREYHSDGIVPVGRHSWQKPCGNPIGQNVPFIFAADEQSTKRRNQPFRSLRRLSSRWQSRSWRTARPPARLRRDARTSIRTWNYAGSRPASVQTFCRNAPTSRQEASDCCSRLSASRCGGTSERPHQTSGSQSCFPVWG